MKLLVDVGNSRIKWSFRSADGTSTGGEVAHDGDWAPAAVALRLKAMLAIASIPAEVRIANVAGPEGGRVLRDVLQDRFGRVPVFAQPALEAHGLRNGYRDPSQLGIDRWLAVCAAWSRYRTALFVLDAGTATTVDIVDASGQHRGGFIIPGLTLMTRVLLRDTGDLQRLARSTAPDREHGTARADVSTAAESWRSGCDTATAIEQGARLATAGLVTSGLDHFAVGGVAPLPVLTGGHAGSLRALLPEATQVHPDLVLDGLALEPPCFLPGSAS